MSVRNGFVLLLALSALMFLAACGGSSSGVANPVAPPSGSFSNSSLNGTYVFAVSGLDATGAPYSMAGTFTAGSGGISGGTIDINDPAEFSTPVADAAISSSSSYSITVDGRAQTKITVSGITGGFPVLNLDFVLSTGSSGLVSEIDNFGTGTGTIDAQTANVTPSGQYAFSLSGAFGSGTLTAAGNFILGSGGAISSGLEDFNDNGGTIGTAETLTGSVVVSSSAPSTTLSTSSYPNLTFDVFPISSSHLKFIEMDTTATLSGDAFSQTSTAMPTGTLPFTLAGTAGTSATPFFAAGGFLVTDGNGNITSSSSEDYNLGGSLSPSGSVSFTGTYTASPAGAGRYTLGLTSFNGGSTYVAYPSSGGVLLMDVDSGANIVTTGAAYGPQSSTASLNTGAGYGLNLAGAVVSGGALQAFVYDTGEFATASSGNTISSGAIDEGFLEPGPQLGSSYGVPLTNGTYTAPSGGRGSLTVTASSSNGNNTTLNGGLNLIYYTVDGTTFPFIEYDSGQVSAGILVLQNPSSSSASVAKPESMFVPHLPLRPSVKKKAQ